MTGTTLHVVDGDSARDVLGRALRAMRREDRVVALLDDLSIGPINPAESRARIAWAAQELGFDGGETILRRIDNAWSEALAPATRRIVWTSRRSARDYAGFLEWLWRLGDRPCDVVDLTDLRFPERCTEGPAAYLGLVMSLGALSPEQIVELGLLDLAKPLSDAERSRYRDAWSRLRDENAPLRVVSAAGLHSAPITFCDDELMSYAGENWRKVARIVGETLTSGDEFAPCSDLFLAARVRALAEAGRLEARGDPLKMRLSEVRLPARRASTPGS